MKEGKEDGEEELHTIVINGEEYRFSQDPIVKDWFVWKDRPAFGTYIETLEGAIHYALKKEGVIDGDYRHSSYDP